jgi:hypothetical protein
VVPQKKHTHINASMGLPPGRLKGVLAMILLANIFIVYPSRASGLNV